MCGQRLEEVGSVEHCAGGGNADRSGLYRQEAVDGFHGERRADGVYVLAGCRGASLDAASFHDDVDEGRSGRIVRARRQLPVRVCLDCLE